VTIDLVARSAALGFLATLSALPTFPVDATVLHQVYKTGSARRFRARSVAPAKAA
jgi:hypothetical protein